VEYKLKDHSPVIFHSLVKNLLFRSSQKPPASIFIDSSHLISDSSDFLVDYLKTSIHTLAQAYINFNTQIPKIQNEQDKAIWIDLYENLFAINKLIAAHVSQVAILRTQVERSLNVPYGNELETD
jgi:hypothetical protein